MTDDSVVVGLVWCPAAAVVDVRGFHVDGLNFDRVHGCGPDVVVVLSATLVAISSPIFPVPVVLVYRIVALVVVVIVVYVVVVARPRLKARLKARLRLILPSGLLEVVPVIVVPSLLRRPVVIVRMNARFGLTSLVIGIGRPWPGPSRILRLLWSLSIAPHVEQVVATLVREVTPLIGVQTTTLLTLQALDQVEKLCEIRIFGLLCKRRELEQV